MNDSRGLYHSFKELKNSLNSLFKDSPSFIFLFFCICVISVYYILSYSLTVMTGVAVLIVIGTSLIVYYTTKNYGEAALALVAGLLTIFSVEWTIPLSIVFVISWIAFTTIVLMIFSIRLAAKSEDIYVHAAQFISDDPNRIQEIRSQLEEIGKNHKGLLGPIEKAEALRVLAFRQVPITQMDDYLIGVDLISSITRVNFIDVSNFFAEIYRLVDITPQNRYRPTVDGIYDFIKQTPAHPSEYMEAFKHSRSLVLGEEIELIQLLRGIRRGLGMGVIPENMYSYLSENQQE